MMDRYPYMTIEDLNYEMGRFINGEPPYADYILYSVDKDGKQSFVAQCDASVCDRVAKAFGLEVCDIGGPGEDEEEYQEQSDRFKLRPDDIYPKEMGDGYDWDTTEIECAVVEPNGDVVMFTTSDEVAKTAAEGNDSLRVIYIADSFDVY